MLNFEQWKGFEGRVWKKEYPNFTIRVSNCAVKFIGFSRERQLDVIACSCYDRI